MYTFFCGFRFEFRFFCNNYCIFDMHNEQNLNIIIRPCRMFGYPEYVRISIGNPEENKRLIEALENIVNRANEE